MASKWRRNEPIYITANLRFCLSRTGSRVSDDLEVIDPAFPFLKSWPARGCALIGCRLFISACLTASPPPFAAAGDGKGVDWELAREFNPGSPMLVTHSPGTNYPATVVDHCFFPAMSGNGRYIAFASEASNLVTNHLPSGGVNIYRFDTVTKRTELATIGLGREGANGYSGDFSLSDDGEWMVFSSNAGNLTRGDTNGGTDIFIRDFRAQQTTLVSVNETGQRFRVPMEAMPILSSNGSRVAFLGSGLSKIDINSNLDAYSYDVAAKDLSVLSKGTNGLTGDPIIYAVDMASSAAITVFLGTQGANLVTGERTGALSYLYIYDHLKQALSFYPTNQLGAQLKEKIGFTFRISPDRVAVNGNGKTVFFNIDAGLYYPLVSYNVETGNTEIIALNQYDFRAGYPTLDPLASYDGSRALQLWNATNFLWDALLGILAVPAPTASLRFSGADIALNNIFYTGQNGSSSNSPESFLLLRYPFNGPELLPFASTGSIPDPEISISANGQRTVFERAELVQSLWDRPLTEIVMRDDSSGEETRGAAPLSGATDRNPGGDSRVREHSITADGRFIVFESAGNRFGPSDTNGWMDVYLWDRHTESYSLVSKRFDGRQAGNRASYHGMISADGRYIFFASRATNLTKDTLTNSLSWYMVERGGISATRLFAAPPWAGGANPPIPSLSSNGQQVAYNDFKDGNSFSREVRVFNVLSGSNTLIAAATSLSQLPELGPFISADGQKVAYAKYSEGLRVYVHDLKTGKANPVTPSYKGAPPLPRRIRILFTPDSDFLVCSIFASPGFQLYDLRSQTSSILCTNCDDIAIAADFSAFAYRASVADINHRVGQIYIVDRITSQETAVGGTGGSPGEVMSEFSLSARGRFLAFHSRAADIVHPVSPWTANVFLYDRKEARRFLVSKSIFNELGGNRSSLRAMFSPDSSYLLFHSFANDLSQERTDGHRGVYLYPLTAGDTDIEKNGLADAWEISHFGSAGNDPNADPDGDGASNRAEFLAGTSPVSASSAFRIIGLKTDVEGRWVLEWSATPGKQYRVQSSSSLSGVDWTPVDLEVVPQTMIGSKQLPAPSAQDPPKYYRVLLLESP